MNAKISLSFDKRAIAKAKRNADAISVRLENLPISDWVTTISKGEVEYKTTKRSKKKMKEEFFASNR